MKMKQSNPNIKRTFMGFLCTFAVMAVLFAWLYKVGVNRPPLRYANIPDSTIDFLNDLGKLGKDLGISYTDNGPFDWEDEDNLGEQDENGWEKEYDENFIIYYHRDKDAIWQEYAQQVLRLANENIVSLTDLMGRYYYASDMNGRKLAIYLANTESVYEKTINELMEATVDSKGSLGMYIWCVGPFGCLTKGIVINPQCFDVDFDTPNGVNGFITTVCHEMNHYVFFSSLDYSKEIRHYLWVSEGLAEFYANRRGHLLISDRDSINFIEKNCKLNAEFPGMGSTEYWAGEAFYNYLYSDGGYPKVKQFTHMSYSTGTDSVFIKLKTPSSKVHKQWVEAMRSHASSKTVSSSTTVSQNP